MKIGLAFPELGLHNINHFIDVMEQNNSKLDLLILPEGFETIPSKNELRPEEIKNEPELKDIVNKYLEICKNLTTTVILGVQIDYHNTSRSGGNNDQYCLLIKVTVHRHAGGNL